MEKIKPIDYKLLRRKLDPIHLGFKNTNEIKAITRIVGQNRALEALKFGIGIKSQGYNLYAMGPQGIGKRTLLSSVLAIQAHKQKIPPDWCYIHNFKIPEKPIAIKLPAGLGLQLQNDMKEALDDITTSMIAVLDSVEYRRGIKKIRDVYTHKRKRIREEEGIKISNPELYKEQYKREKNLRARYVSNIIEPIIKRLSKKYAKFPNVITYFNAARQDIINNVNDIVQQDDKTDLFTLSLENPALTKYKVNLLVDNSKLKQAPVIFENSPSYATLITRIEHTSNQGNLTTNFTLIRPGALHLANGGYLIIEARKIKKNPEAWEALKSCLYSHRIQIKPIETDVSVRPVSLEPMDIPLDIKIILIGDRNNYYTLCHRDPDFVELFKVAVDFDEEINRNPKNIHLYAELIATIARRHKLVPLHVNAVSRIIDQSSRLAEDTQKLTTHVRDIEDLIIESAYWAAQKNKHIIQSADVTQAINAQIHRMDRSRELYYEDILRNFIIIKTAGKTIGQVNCLSVRRVGNFAYGHPTRVTARVRIGKGRLIDIQREIKMAGPMHSKAGLTILNFLASRFTEDRLFSLVCSISFEQIYCWTDGDSASVGELCALLSALAEVPLLQHFAITGSADQYGEVQAIGGVNEKIEGFYDVCKAQGLNGKHGVIIPTVNIKNLMLREDIVKAARTGKFSIYAINSVDEALALLTGLDISTRDAEGNYLESTLYHKIEKRLKKFSRNSKYLIEK